MRGVRPRFARPWGGLRGGGCGASAAALRAAAEGSSPGGPVGGAGATRLCGRAAALCAALGRVAGWGLRCLRGRPAGGLAGAPRRRTRAGCGPARLCGGCGRALRGLGAGCGVGAAVPPQSPCGRPGGGSSPADPCGVRACSTVRGVRPRFARPWGRLRGGGCGASAVALRAAWWGLLAWRTRGGCGPARLCGACGRALRCLGAGCGVGVAWRGGVVGRGAFVCVEVVGVPILRAGGRDGLREL